MHDEGAAVSTPGGLDSLSEHCRLSLAPDQIIRPQARPSSVAPLKRTVAWECTHKGTRTDQSTEMPNLQVDFRVATTWLPLQSPHEAISVRSCPHGKRSPRSCIRERGSSLASTTSPLDSRAQ